MNKTIGVGLIGYGIGGSVFHAPLILAEPRLRLVQVATSRPLMAECLAAGAEAVTDTKALIANPEIDLVVITNPNRYHYGHALAAILQGKAVVVDKPFTLTVAEAEELTQLAASRGQLLSVFHNRRFDAHLLTVQQVLQSGVIGEPMRCEIHFDRFRPEPKGGWRESEDLGGGVYLDLAPHLLDQAVTLFGTPDSVHGDIYRQRASCKNDDGFILTLGYNGAAGADGLRVILRASILVAEPGARITIHGTKGSLIQYGFDEQEAQLKAGLRPKPGGVDADWGWSSDLVVKTYIPDQNGDNVVTQVKNCRGDYTAFYRGIADALLHGAPPPVTAPQATTIMRLLELGAKKIA